ncbi:MAG TPA: chemotaxis protein CheD [Caulobacterales bacterium]|jgi:chemotaxis protein CheD|nr:chemotaxis protein CheD [Caulobacterales bacterium]
MNAAALAPPSEPGEERIHLIQGDYHVTGAPNVMLTTTLGSCVAACLRDPIANIGGMNHFLLPEGEGAQGREAQKYGAYAMELLVNGLLRAGARRERLQANLFGGARLSARLVDVGGKNVAFAEAFLRREGIAMGRSSVRGAQARRVQFWPATGRLRQLLLTKYDSALIEAERAAAKPDYGAVELF